MSTGLTVVSWNVANAKKDETESEGKYKFGNRFRRIVEMLQKINPDILCVQEIRKCSTGSNDDMWDPHKIIDIFRRELKMQCKFTANNTTELSFYRATFYKSEKVFPISEKTIWTGKNENVPSGA